MTEIPEPEVNMELLAKWFAMAQEISKLKQQEGLLRKRIFTHFFPKPKEGTNTHILPDGYQLKATHVVNRTVDPATVRTLRESFVEKQIPIDDLVDWKPSLVKSIYNGLTEEQQHLFDQCLIVKDGSPTLTISAPSTKPGKKIPEDPK